MIICLDVGNTNIFGGVFKNEKDLLTFRTNTIRGITSDEFGLFLRNVIRENNLNPHEIQHISIGSVVPSIDYSLRAACIKYFNISPFFLKASTPTNLLIKYDNPLQVGADNIANAIAAIDLFPNKDIIVADYGTATVFCPITSKKEFLGGCILPGLRLSMEALANNTSMLFPVEILKPSSTYGKNTTESIQTGLYYSQLGALREFIEQIKHKEFAGKNPLVIATGGFAHLFNEEGLFDKIIPDLTLHGLRIALDKFA